MLISIVIPLYNEEECIDLLVDPLVDVFHAANVNYELVLVDNGSHDKTGELIDSKVKENSKIRKIWVKKNEGYGWGIISGLKAAEGDYIGFMCGDGQVSPQDVVKTIKHILEHDCDMAKVRRTKRNDGFVRRVVTQLYNGTIPFLFGLKSRDLNGTPKIFKRAHLELFDPWSKDWFIDAELMIKAEYLNFKIDEIPIVFEARKGGESHISVISAACQFLQNAFRFKTERKFDQWKKSRLSSLQADKVRD